MLDNCLMVQGTSSDAGKTTLVAGLCRVLARRNAKVAPFKPQNMALNSAVTPEGGELGRAQALQAQACGIEPHVDMNPVLIKPSSDTGAQIIIQGHALADMDAKNFHAYKPRAKHAVLESFHRLQGRYDIVLVEGAGSPAEVNLREGDIANMGFAEAVDCPVILVADIDRGGVFAQLVGTLDLLSKTEQDRVIGFVINKFRGDLALLEPGLRWLEARTNKKVYGVLPYLHDFFIDSEDAVDSRQRLRESEARLRVVVPVLPHTSNHTDFDSLRQHPQVELQFVSCADTCPQADLIILPGSKNVRGDLAHLQTHQWQQKLQRHLRFGGKLIGICGGYQMLGERIVDELGVEGEPGAVQGFGLLPSCTTFERDKTLKQKHGSLNIGDEAVEIYGYEIHHGISSGSGAVPSASKYLIRYSDETHDGVMDSSGQIFGCYLHGLFDSAAALTALLNWAGLQNPEPFDLQMQREQALDRLANEIESNIDLSALFDDCLKV